jgi:hypothetical protein
MIGKKTGPASEFATGYAPLQLRKPPQSSVGRARQDSSQMPFAGPRLAGAVEKPLSKPLAGRAAAAASPGPHAAGRAPATAASVAELDMRVARDLTVPANRHADRVEKAGEAFVNVVSTKLRDFRTFDGSQRLKNSRLYAQRIVRAALYLDDYQKLGGAPGLAITSLVRETRSAMASTFQSLLASDDFKIAELDFEELKALQSALEMFGVPMEGLDDKFNAAHHALAASRVRFLDVEGLSNDASPAKPIPTRQQFIDSVRAPQRDITFLGFTIRARDTAYKGLLAQLDTYHGAATGKHASVEDAQAVRTAFVAAKQSVESYVANLSNAQSDRDAVRVHILPLQRELAVLDRAITTIRRSPQHLPADLQTLCTRERAVASEIFSMVRGPDSAFTELNAQGAVRHGLTPELARSCATRSPERAEKMTPLGKGAINTVYLAKLSVPGRLRGFACRRYQQGSPHVGASQSRHLETQSTAAAGCHTGNAPRTQWSRTWLQPGACSRCFSLACGESANPGQSRSCATSSERPGPSQELRPAKGLSRGHARIHRRRSEGQVDPSEPHAGRQRA